MADGRAGGTLGRVLDVAWAIAGTYAAVIGLRLMLAQPPLPPDGSLNRDGDSGPDRVGDRGSRSVSANALTNSGFEIATDVLYPPLPSYSDVPPYWSTSEGHRNGGRNCAIVTGDAMEGTHYARCVVNGTGTRWSFMLLQNGIRVQDGRRYLIRLHARGAGRRSFALDVARSLDGFSYTPESSGRMVTVGTAWTEVRYDVTACVRASERDACGSLSMDFDARLALLLGGEEGTLEFDDVQFVEVL